jgi:DNA-binding beta-propeller fold protein YncE
MRITASLLALLVLAGVSSAARVHVFRLGRAPALETGTPWTVKLAVRPKSFAGAVRLKATGPARLSIRAKGRRGAYRARLVFPRSGRWTLSALAGGSTSRLGTVTVRRRAEPLAFDNPTSVAVEPSGSLLVVENGAGRVVRVDPATGFKTVVASGLSRPYSIALTDSGEALLSTESNVVRLDAGGPQIVASLPGSQIGPILTAPGGDLYFGVVPGIFRVPTGTGVPVQLAGGLASPHGLALTAEGSLLVSDTGHDAILRIDLRNGRVETFARQESPLGLARAPDGSVYVCDDLRKRIVRFSSTGERLGFLGPVFDIPYGLAADPAGGVYVTEAAAKGRVKHVAADGTVTTLSSR